MSHYSIARSISEKVNERIDKALLKKISKNERDRVPVKYNYKIETEAMTKGQIFGWFGFKKGIFREPNIFEWIILYTTMVTDIGDILWETCLKLDPKSLRKVIKPNGPLSTYFMISYTAQNFIIFIERVMKREAMEKLPKRPFSAENPQNYDVTIKIECENTNLIKHIVDVLKNHCQGRKFIETSKQITQQK